MFLSLTLVFSPSRAGTLAFPATATPYDMLHGWPVCPRKPLPDSVPLPLTLPPRLPSLLPPPLSQPPPALFSLFPAPARVHISSSDPALLPLPLGGRGPALVRQPDSRSLSTSRGGSASSAVKAMGGRVDRCVSPAVSDRDEAEPSSPLVAAEGSGQPGEACRLPGPRPPASPATPAPKPRAFEGEGWGDNSRCTSQPNPSDGLASPCPIVF